MRCVRVSSPVRPASAALLALLWACCAAAADSQKTAHSSVALLAEQQSLPAEGGTVTLGLQLEPDPGWHAYWRNPGDAGKEASIGWALPEGFAASELRFPTPTLIPFGEFNTYGFKEPVLLLADLAVPAGLAPGGSVELGGDARWVVCDDELCVPEQARLTLVLPVGDGSAEAAQADAFAAARRKLPEAVAWPGRFEVAEGAVRFALDVGDRDLEAEYLFVAPKRVVEYSEQTRQRTASGWQFAMPKGRRADGAEHIDAVLRYRDANSAESRGALLRFAPGAVAAAPPVAAPSVAGAGSAAGFLDVAKALVFGLVGGVLLNLMPCVFPILSMKALGVVELSRTDRRTARASGVFYTIGVLATFLAIAVLLIALRAAGEAVGWGFQLQSPWVVFVLGLGMVAIGLNLFGTFEIGTRAMGLGQGLTATGERQQSLLTGALAVVVATPCTAPFMAGALGFALVQPVVVALAVFLALGLGLALPYLAVTFIPALARGLPKPGGWMQTFRRVLAFPMLATALWLFWVLGRQLGATAMGLAILAALLLAFALWAYGQGASARWRVAALGGLLACLATGSQVARAPDASDDGALALEPFTPERVLGYIAAEQPVFVYFTADWCISCKVNERVALATDAVAEAFNERGIKVVEADWTTEDPVITDWLAKYDRAGVPLYLYFPRGASLETATVLPQVLLPGIVIDAIESADAAA